MAEKKAPKADGSAKPKSINKSAFLNQLAEETQLSRKQISDVFEALHKLISHELGKKGPGVLTIPGLLKLTRVTKPATKAGMRPSPFDKTKMIEVKAKPASVKVRARPLKALNELIAK